MGVVFPSSPIPTVLCFAAALLRSQGSESHDALAHQSNAPLPCSVSSRWWRKPKKTDFKKASVRSFVLIQSFVPEYRPSCSMVPAAAHVQDSRPPEEEEMATNPGKEPASKRAKLDSEAGAKEQVRKTLSRDGHVDLDMLQVEVPTHIPAVPCIGRALAAADHLRQSPAAAHALKGMHGKGICGCLEVSWRRLAISAGPATLSVLSPAYFRHQCSVH